MRLNFAYAMAALAVAVSTPAVAQTRAPIRLNQIQVIGSHNSYHAGLPPSAAALLRKSDPKAADHLDYQHPALDVQLNRGIRQLEIDVFADAKGGRYANPAGLRMISPIHAFFHVAENSGFMMLPWFTGSRPGRVSEFHCKRSLAASAMASTFAGGTFASNAS